MKRGPAPILDLDFPYPPSEDRYWLSVGARIVLSLEARRYREQVAAIVAQYTGPPLEGRLSGHVTFHPPDERRRDPDDGHMVMLDALMHFGAFEDCEQIRNVEFRRGPVAPGGKVVVCVEDAT